MWQGWPKTHNNKLNMYKLSWTQMCLSINQINWCKIFHPCDLSAEEVWATHAANGGSGMRKRQTTTHPSHHTAVLLIAFLRQHGSELLNGHLGFGEGLHHHRKIKPKVWTNHVQLLLYSHHNRVSCHLKIACTVTAGPGTDSFGTWR